MRHQGYMFRLRGLTESQQQALVRFDGQARWLWNVFLSADLRRRERRQSLPTLNERNRVLTDLRSHVGLLWLKDGSSASQQATLRNLDRAWSKFFAGIAGRPKFKKRCKRNAFQWCGRQHAQLDQANSRIKLPKIGWVRYRSSRRVEGDVIGVTIRREGRCWQMALNTERKVDDPMARSFRKRVGLDVGIACHTATSAGHMIAGPSAMQAAALKLRRAQRKLARAKKGSKRKKKQTLRVARVHERIVNVRKDHLHKLTTAIAKNHGLVCVEGLQVANMSRSAKGAVGQPGRNVRAKAALNRRILDQGWSEMRRQLTYKLGWNGGTLISVPPANTSRRCSACQHVDKASRLSQATFICTACGHEINADTNAAKNILAMGYAMARAAGPVAVKARGGDAIRQPLSRVSRASRPRDQHFTVG